MDVASLVNEYGFPAVMVVGLGYFVYFVWNFVNTKLQPEIDKQHLALIKLIDRMRMLDQDLIRLQQKVDVVLKYREIEELKKKGEKTNED
ncbi:MAG: hypothetical protein CBD54_004235 [Alphaproteobacteria bacterium TMED194]|nr:MAG: hypothetical protein CBD54_004235 [Alphaproteobacteria bacterium TMED194]|tara:strand:+ start:338 stop:607 length:270 start_codon:yes stop_codon:yes gene_type:complete